MPEVNANRWTEKEQTQAEVQTFILDRIYEELPEPPYSSDDKQLVAALVYQHVWQQSPNHYEGDCLIHLATSIGTVRHRQRR